MTDQEALKKAKQLWGAEYGERVFCSRPFGILHAAGVSGSEFEDGFYFSGDSWEEVFAKAEKEKPDNEQ